MRRSQWFLLAALCVAVLLAGTILITSRLGARQFVDSDQVQQEPGRGIAFAPGQVLGQTFVARHGGLDAVDLYISPGAGYRGTVTLHLRDSPFSSVDLLTSAVTLDAESVEGFFRFSFPPIVPSHTRYYYTYLESEGTGTIEAQQGPLNAYHDGTLYLNQEPQDAQMVFRLGYDARFIVLDLLRMAASWMGYGLAALGLLFFSGYWLVRGWARKGNFDFTATLILGASTALAAWMVFLAWASLFFTLQPATVQIIVGASSVLGLVQFARDRDRWRKRAFWLGASPWSTLALWSVILLSVALRLFVGRGMVMLPGSDAYHHTLIVQLFEDQGGIPRSYEPYAPLTSFSYHYGFHSIVALFRWLFGSELLLTTKSVALALNGAIAATVALVAERWAGNRRAGVVAAATVGLIAVSPFSLLRWSRFTQTAGLYFLSMGLLALTASRKRAGWFLPSVLLVGVVASHYRVAFLLVPFALIYGCVAILSGRWDRARRLVVTGIAGVILAAPWLLRVAWVQYDPHGLRIVPPILAGVNSLQRLGEPVLSYVTNGPVIVAAILLGGLVLFDRRKRRDGRLLVAWAVVLAYGAFAAWILGISLLMDTKSTVLSLAVPLGILAGLAAEPLWSLSLGRRRALARAAVTLVLLLGMGIGVCRLPRLLQGDSSYRLRPGHLEAANWIESNVPENALLLVDSIQFSYAPGWVVGVDTGLWLPLLAHRSTTVPPMIYSIEWGKPGELANNLEATQQYLASRNTGAPSLRDIITKFGITHLFTGPHTWSLIPSELEQEAKLNRVFHQDRLWLFCAVR
ncbi:hypothetical protein ACFLT5_01275 [Chloroflexota bacterium]